MSDTVVIVGNGAIENGDRVFQDSVLNIIGEKDNIVNKFQCNLSCPANILSFVATKLRTLRAYYFNRVMYDEKHEKFDDYFFELDISELRTFILIKINFNKNFKSEIDKRNASKDESAKLKLRHEPALEEFFSFQDTFITLNWDPVLKEHIKIVNPLYVHGDISDPGKMILPMDIMLDFAKYHDVGEYFENRLEEYIKANKNKFDTIKEKMVKTGVIKGTEEDMELSDYLRMLFLDRDRYSYLQTIHTQAEKYISNASKIVIWGCSIAEYDSEIYSMIIQSITRSSNSKKLKKYIIINPDEVARHRFAELLFGVDSSMRLDYDPIKKLKITYV